MNLITNRCIIYFFFKLQDIGLIEQEMNTLEISSEEQNSCLIKLPGDLTKSPPAPGASSLLRALVLPINLAPHIYGVL